MILYPPSLQAVGGARTGIAPVNLLDVQDVNGNFYFWSDRRVNAPFAILPTSATVDGTTSGYPVAPGNYTTTVLPTSSNHNATGGAYATTTNTTGLMRFIATGDFQTTISWSGFEWPELPPGAIVTAIQPVVTYEGWNNNELDCVFAPSPEIPGSSYNLEGFPSLSSSPSSPSSGTFTRASLGTTPDVLTGLALGFYFNSTAPWASINAELSVSSVSLLISYTIPGAGGGATPGAVYPGLPPTGIYEPWILTIPPLTFHRSSVTDVGSFILQNLSGDTVSRDFEKILRRSALEGAYFIYRCWQPDAQASWIQVDGTLTVEDVGVDTLTLKGAPVINPAQEDTAAMQFSETCQWRWSSPQCGATGDTECGYSYQTCQVPDRILVVLNDYEKNYGEAHANVPTQTINRARHF